MIHRRRAFPPTSGLLRRCHEPAESTCDGMAGSVHRRPAHHRPARHEYDPPGGRGPQDDRRGRGIPTDQDRGATDSGSRPDGGRARSPAPDGPGEPEGIVVRPAFSDDVGADPRGAQGADHGGHRGRVSSGFPGRPWNCVRTPTRSTACGPSTSSRWAWTGPGRRLSNRPS
jgi:hypothetical protein